MNQPSIVVVVGADGFIGSGLAKSLDAERVVYGSPSNGATHIGDAEDLIARADVVVNCGGFRVQPGCSYQDYRRTHEGSTAAFVPWIRAGAKLVQISSVAVLGRGEGLSNESPANPAAYPAPGYARAKREEDDYLKEASAARDFRVIFLRPSVVYSRAGAGMIGTLIGFARHGIALRLYPRRARHHLVDMELLAEVVRRVIGRDDLPNLCRLLVTNPYTITNLDLEMMIRQASRKSPIPLPLPVHWLSAFLRHTFHSTNPRHDLKTWGEIFGVMAIDSTYQGLETMQLLGIDPHEYSIDRTLKPLIAAALKGA